MQRNKSIVLHWILVFFILGANHVFAQDTDKQAKAEMSARKTAAAKATQKAKSAAKAVQKAQDNSAAKRLQADKLLGIAASDKAKLTSALGRNASQKELEKLTQVARKSGDAAQKAQEEADLSSREVQAAIVAARQAEVQERVAFEALDARRAGIVVQTPLQPLTPQTPLPAVAPSVVSTTPSASKTEEESDRQRRLAGIETAVAAAKEKHEPILTPAPAAPPVSAAPPASVPPSLPPIAVAAPASVSVGGPTLTPESEKKAREILRNATLGTKQAPQAQPAPAPTTSPLVSPPVAALPREKQPRTSESMGPPPSGTQPAPVAPTLTPELEQKARALLHSTKVTPESARNSTPLSLPPPVAPSISPVSAVPLATPPGAPIAATPPASPPAHKPAPLVNQNATAALTSPQEAKARELLSQRRGESKPVATAPSTPVIPTTPIVSAPPVNPSIAPPPVAPPANPPERVVPQPAPIVTTPAVPSVNPPTDPSLLVSPSTLPGAAKPVQAMTPEQEAKAHQLLEQQMTGTVSSPNSASPAKARREAQKKAEAEARALEAQRKAEAKARLQAEKQQRVKTASVPVLIVEPETKTIVSPPVRTDAQAPDAAKAHEQALENAKAAAKVQLKERSKEDQKPVRTDSVSAPEKVAVKTRPTAGESKALPEVNPLPISGTKQQRLVQLLEAYKKEQISPAQYHQERARILAEP